VFEATITAVGEGTVQVESGSDLVSCKLYLSNLWLERMDEVGPFLVPQVFLRIVALIPIAILLEVDPFQGLFYGLRQIP